MTTANNYPTSASILTFPGCIEVKVISDKMYIARHRTYLIRYMYIQYTYRAVLHSKSHQKSIKCQNFLRVWHFLGQTSIKHPVYIYIGIYWNTWNISKKIFIGAYWNTYILSDKAIYVYHWYCRVTTIRFHVTSKSINLILQVVQQNESPLVKGFDFALHVFNFPTSSLGGKGRGGCQMSNPALKV